MTGTDSLPTRSTTTREQHIGRRMSDNPQTRVPESYTWTLIAMLVVMLPQVLVPVRSRVGPPLIVPIIEAAAFLAMFVIAAMPGPVPRRVRPFVLFLFSTLIVANASAAIRLVVLVLDGGE